MPEISSKIYDSTEEAWESMLSACRKAKVSIDMEQYIFSNDRIGKQFIEIFRNKAQKGVRVRLLVDTAGSYRFYQSDIPDQFRRDGIEVRFFNIISPWRFHNFFSWLGRNHKKTLVIDGNIGFTGGTGIGDYMRSWRDTTGRVEGEVVEEITGSFMEMWELANEKNFISKLKRWKAYKKKIEFITNAPYFKKGFLYDAMLGALENAEKSIFLTNPYFIPTHKLKRILRKAARRGISVMIIVPERVDVLVVASASNSSFETLLRSGVRIFKYQREILHAKTAIIDDKWGTYGSFNLDGLSFFYNYEGNIVTTDQASVSELKEHFVRDLKYSREILLSKWQRRPMLRKVQEFFIAPFGRFL